jgi:hypothetical protein
MEGSVPNDGKAIDEIKGILDLILAGASRPTPK